MFSSQEFKLCHFNTSGGELSQLLLMEFFMQDFKWCLIAQVRFEGKNPLRAKHFDHHQLLKNMNKIFSTHCSTLQKIRYTLQKCGLYATYFKFS